MFAILKDEAEIIIKKEKGKGTEKDKNDQI